MLTILFSALLMCLLFFFCITTVFTILFFCSSLYNKDTALNVSTEDGSTGVVPQILYGPYLILGVFGGYMF